MRCWAKAKVGSSLSDSDGMGSIPAILDARNVPLLLCHKRFNEASLPAVNAIYARYDLTFLVCCTLLAQKHGHIPAPTS